MGSKSESIFSDATSTGSSFKMSDDDNATEPVNEEDGFSFHTDKSANSNGSLLQPQEVVKTSFSNESQEKIAQEIVQKEEQKPKVLPGAISVQEIRVTSKTTYVTNDGPEEEKKEEEEENKEENTEAEKEELNETPRTPTTERAVSKLTLIPRKNSYPSSLGSRSNSRNHSAISEDEVILNKSSETKLSHDMESISVISDVEP